MGFWGMKFGRDLRGQPWFMLFKFHHRRIGWIGLTAMSSGEAAMSGEEEVERGYLGFQ